MDRFRVRPHDYTHGSRHYYSGLWVIDERVSESGLYITWDEKFTTKESAEKFLLKFQTKQTDK